VEACRKELLQKLHDSGGRRIDFGVESGNEEIRSMILKRRMTNQQIIDATQWAKEAGLQVKTLNMVGLPEETKDKFADTIKINQKINPDVVSLHVFFPYPGTELYDYCLKKGYYEGDLSLPEGYVSRRQSVLNLPGFTKKEITRCFHSFGFKVFRKYSLVKAIGYALMYSEHGEFWLDMTKHFRTALRRILKGL
jgi:anaerobic magnesium-protoporphyrin IX monomethyl ester cyclase